MHQKRPGHLELFGKVQAAATAIAAGRYYIGVEDHVSADLAEMEIDDTNELWDLLPQLLEELKASVPGDCYRGGRPTPDEAVEPGVEGLDLWAFAWESKQLDRAVYLKFCLKQSRTSGETYYAHVRLHKNRPPPRRTI